MILHSPTHPTYHSADRVAEIAPIHLGSLALSSAESLFYEQLLSHSPIIGSQRLSNLGLDERDMAILTTVANCRLITTLQLQRLHFIRHNSPISSARACRRVLKRLYEKKIISRRNRRIGGVRRGSASFVYSIGTVGIKLLDNSGKPLHPYTTDPSDYFFEHTLALSELYTQIHELAVSKKLVLLEVQTEPNCWRQYNTNYGKLRPDMFVRIAKNDEEYSYFIELDRGTTHLPSILRKLQQYEQYYASGVEQQNHGVFPQVLWIVPDDTRKSALESAIQATQRPIDKLFVVRSMNSALFLSQ